MAVALLRTMLPRWRTVPWRLRLRSPIVTCGHVLPLAGYRLLLAELSPEFHDAAWASHRHDSRTRQQPYDFGTQNAYAPATETAAQIKRKSHMVDHCQRALMNRAAQSLIAGLPLAALNSGAMRCWALKSS